MIENKPVRSLLPKPPEPMRAILIVLMACLLTVGRLAGEEPVKAPAKTLPLLGEVFALGGRAAFLILPDKTAGQAAVPWVWYAPTLPGLPGPEEKWMFERFTAAGIAIAGIDAGESYGSPAGRAVFSSLYKELTGKRGLARKPVLLARSRGGLMAYNWAAENAGLTGGIAGIYPVCNLESYPGLDKACGAYGMSAAELKEHLAEQNPIERLAPLARAGVPIFHIHGDVDTVVPLERNTGEVESRYRKLGGNIQVIVPKGQGHNMWPGFFQCQELVDFVIAQAKKAE